MKYKTIYCDPPWQADENRTVSTSWINMKNNYKMMKLQDIKDMKTIIDDISEDDCHLYMWVTSNFLQEGLDTMKHWGFKYITNIVWNKTSGMGIGNYFRNFHEICLFGRKGRPLIDRHVFIKSVISAPRREHSRKPDEMYDVIEKRSLGPYIELFARQTREGWNSWGNEVGKFDKGETE